MQRLAEIALTHSPTAVLRWTEVAAWVRGSADAEAALVKRALAAGDVISICRGLDCPGARHRGRAVESLEAS